MYLFYSLIFTVTLASNVLVGTDHNLTSLLFHSQKTTLVDFYAEWCRHCKLLMPTIENLAERFAIKHEIQIVKVNGDKDGRKMAKKYNVGGYPTLLLFIEGSKKPVQYIGVRDFESISNFIQVASGVRLDDETAISKKDLGFSLMKTTDMNFTDQAFNDKPTLVLIQGGTHFSEELSSSWYKMALDNENSNLQYIEHFFADDIELESPVLMGLDGEGHINSILLPVSSSEHLSAFVSHHSALVNSPNATGNETFRDFNVSFEEYDGTSCIAILDFLIKVDDSKFYQNQKNIGDLRIMSYYHSLIHMLRDNKQALSVELTRLQCLLQQSNISLTQDAKCFTKLRVKILQGMIKYKQ
ncbi:putative protein disulfide isomerase [Candidozyma auris]|nr:putative protein disulfide isomerase [[Candida] auris]